MNDGEAMSPVLRRLQGTAGIFAGLGAVGCVVALLKESDTFMQCYLFAFIFWMGLTMGCLGLTMLHHMIRGKWGQPALRIWEAGNKNLPWMFILFIPCILAIANHQLYPWAFTHDILAKDPSLLRAVEHKTPYMQLPMFTVRLVLYFAIWLFLAGKLNASSLKQDETGDPTLMSKRANIAAPGLVLFVLTVTFAYTDWVMSLDPRWFSTIFGFWFVVGMGLSASSFTALLTTRWSNIKPYSNVVTEGFTRDIGNVMLTFTMFWAYFSLSQWLIIYSGNLPEETSYYLRRGMDPRHGATAYWILATVILFGQFFIPFVCLLSGRAKRNTSLLFWVAFGILCIRVLDVFWTILPFFQPDQSGKLVDLIWMSASTLSAMGGLWIILFAGNLKKHALLPNHEQVSLTEALEHA
jgi:hypothetical protein